MLHMDIASLTSQLTKLLATGQRSDEQVLALQVEVERLEFNFAQQQLQLLQQQQEQGEQQKHFEAAIPERLSASRQSVDVEAQVRLAEDSGSGVNFEPVAMQASRPHKHRMKRDNIMSELGGRRSLEELCAEHAVRLKQLQQQLSAEAQPLLGRAGQFHHRLHHSLVMGTVDVWCCGY